MKAVIILTIVLLLVIPSAGVQTGTDVSYTPLFDGERAYDHLVAQCDFGPRPPGSENLSRCRDYLMEQLTSHGWYVVLQNFTYLGVPCSNVIARHNITTTNASYIIGAHYDTRPRADNDPVPANRGRPVLGANDGASGVAVILELATVLPISVREDVELVLFDAEDSGNINGWSWIVGSTYYVDSMTASRRAQTRAMILLDMVGDVDLRLLRERDSTRSVQDAVWEIAHELGHSDIFIDQLGQSIIDDHQPFLRAGIPALDVIHHAPFPATWHTISDTPDRCSPQSLECVGRVIEVFLLNYAGSDHVFIPSYDISLIVTSVVLLMMVVVVCLYYRYRQRVCDGVQINHFGALNAKSLILRTNDLCVDI